MPNSNPGFAYGDIPSAVAWDAAFTDKVDAADGLFTTPVLLKVYTVATLPAASTALRGALAAVSDATSPTYNATLTGGGTVYVPVFCNGSAWVSH